MRNSRKRILLLGATTGYQTRVFAEVAERLGHRLVLATDRCLGMDDPWGDEAIGVRFEKPEWSALEIAAGVFGYGVDGIVALGDRPTYLAAVAAERLGMPYNPPAAVERARNKFLARQCFREAGLPVPEYYRLPLSSDAQAAAARARYPCVLKPLGLSGSRGVIRADDAAGFGEAFHRIRAILESRDIVRLAEDHNRFIQVEEYIPGREFALEGLFTAGRLETLALFDKPDPLEGPFFEETIYVTPSREAPQARQAIIEAVGRAAAALGLTRGPLHAEVRVNERGVWPLEVAARPIGGLCAAALRFEGGMRLEEVILRHALGEDVSGVRLEPGASGVMMIPIPKNGIYVGVSGVEEARAVPGITDAIITAKEGQKLMKLPEGASYLGFLFARAGEPAAVEGALRVAHGALRFEIATQLEVVR